MISDLLTQGVAPQRIIRLQCDEPPELMRLSEPILRVMDWYEQAILRKTLNESAQENEIVYLFLDEVQYLTGWAIPLKSLVDHSTINVVVTGSSALRIEAGRDSLAGRIHIIEAGVLSLTEIAEFNNISLGKPFFEENGLEPLTRKNFWIELRNNGKKIAEQRDIVFRYFSERGGYSLAQARRDVPWKHIAVQLFNQMKPSFGD